jgi:alanine dehydrogenase
MDIGVPREIHRHEHRVGLSPFAVARLAQLGHSVLVESKAGDTARFTDRDYEKSGAHIVYSAEEVYKRADLVCRVAALTPDDVELLKPDTIVCAFHHLAVTTREHVERLMALRTTLVGYEVIRNSLGDLPVLTPFSEMGGQMAVQLAAYYLQNESGGRGVLLGNVPGVPPPTVLILGAGTVGQTAARQALGNGAHVIVLDADLNKLRSLSRELDGRAVTVLAGVERLDQYVPIADVIIGAVLIPGGRAPYVVTEAMVKGMKPGSVVIDVSIDQGGCVETSRPTGLDQPTFVVHDVVHYCVSNMTANVARTASRALTTAALPYLVELAGAGLDDAVRRDPGLADGVYIYRGRLANQRVGETLGIPAAPIRGPGGGDGRS